MDALPQELLSQGLPANSGHVDIVGVLRHEVGQCRHSSDSASSRWASFPPRGSAFHSGMALPALTLYPGLTEKPTRGAAMALRGGAFLPDPRAQTPPTSLPREGQAAGKG